MSTFHPSPPQTYRGFCNHPLPSRPIHIYITYSCEYQHTSITFYYKMAVQCFVENIIWLDFQMLRLWLHWGIWPPRQWCLSLHGWPYANLTKHSTTIIHYKFILQRYSINWLGHILKRMIFKWKMLYVSNFLRYISKIKGIVFFFMKI